MTEAMVTHAEWTQAVEMLLNKARPVDVERVPLWESVHRVLARDLVAAENIPPFDRSPYDGYAFRAEDTREASREHPVTLTVLEEIAAGATPTRPVEPGTATRLMTGAPIPTGADAVIMYEKTEFTKETVTLFSPAVSGQNIIRAGEDVPKGRLLAPAGTVIDAGLAGSLGAQGVAEPEVFRLPVAGILSTGNEVAPVGAALRDGQIYNVNLYTLKALLLNAGYRVVDLGHANDQVEEIAAKLEAGLPQCDVVILTGGVSVGDFDLTPAAMERAGASVFLRGVRMKPGMACAYGEKDGKLVLGLSGNPASSATNLSAVVMPALRKIAGWRNPEHRLFPVELGVDFPKKSPTTRFLRGMIDLSGGAARLRLSAEQGNVVISSLIGCDALAVVPSGTGPLKAGTKLEAFFA